MMSRWFQEPKRTDDNTRGWHDAARGRPKSSCSCSLPRFPRQKPKMGWLRTAFFFALRLCDACSQICRSRNVCSRMLRPASSVFHRLPKGKPETYGLPICFSHVTACAAHSPTRKLRELRVNFRAVQDFFVNERAVSHILRLAHPKTDCLDHVGGGGGRATNFLDPFWLEVVRRKFFSFVC